ncbi:LysR substrate-binding domain-containing protein [Candidimonas nitroreducens]|uniref:LysR family transcriptional regulator n=1 Tax=Candidimonas nitroreducens TaxID=683354 RepID=A0A225MXN4_9BURK|nr:LysR substrate-binding domain-containing protein [Candidimonas nitroreducens]OWT65894.1 LysR family transcriptional regulator [Candidimonas nitroreducens]
MPRKIPPMNPLRAFYVVARTKSLTKAAQELHVGQSAISKQLDVLEKYFGVKLFRREQRGISLTDIGQELAQRIVPAFDQIADAAAGIAERSDGNKIRVHTYTTFAAKWLIPRLEDFHTQYPRLSVQIIASVDEMDFENDRIDFSIQLGRGARAGLEVDLLFDDIIEPVCSQGFLLQHAPETAYPQAVLRTRLLDSHYRPKSDWQAWAQACHYEKEIADTPHMNFSSSVLTWQAAMDGLGVAIGQMALLTEDIEKGKLVAPFKQPVRTGLSFRLLRPKAQREERKIVLFRDWILAQAATTRPYLPAC